MHLLFLCFVSVVFVSTDGWERELLRCFGFSMNKSILFSMSERSGEFLMERILIFLTTQLKTKDCAFFCFNGIDAMFSKCVSFKVRTI